MGLRISFAYYEKSITHNLHIMADHVKNVKGEQSLYDLLWRTDRVMKAMSLIRPLQAAIKDLKENKEKYLAYNPESSWGRYEDLLEFCEDTLEAALKYPTYNIHFDK